MKTRRLMPPGAGFCCACHELLLPAAGGHGRSRDRGQPALFVFDSAKAVVEKGAVADINGLSARSSSCWWLFITFVYRGTCHTFINLLYICSFCGPDLVHLMVTAGG